MIDTMSWLQLTEDMSFAFGQGALAGLIFFLGILLIWLGPRYKWLLATLLLVCVTPLALAGFWFSKDELGISDWDYYFSLHTTHRRALLDYHVLPHWNPYTCGGTAGLADPEFRFFTPTFLLQLLVGIPAGLRLSIFLATATGAVGMLFLSKRLGLSVYAALLAAVTVAVSSVNLLEIVEGHPNIFSAMWIPWIFWSLLGAYQARTRQKEKRSAYIWTAICAVFLALTFFEGGMYLLMYTALAFAVLPFLVRRPKDMFIPIVQAGLMALGLAAIKLIPVVLWLHQFQDQAYASSALTLPYLHSILLGRYLHGAGEIIPNQGGGWHEYGAYIGPVVLLLAAVGLMANWKRRLTVALLAAAVLALLLSSAGPFLKPIFDQAPFLPRSNISRVILFAVIPLALLAGFGVDSIRKLQPRIIGTSLALFLIGFAAVDLMSLAYTLSQQAFVLPRVSEHIPPAPAPIAYTAFDYKTRHNGSDYTRAYEAVLRGYGSLSYCAVLGPDPAVRTIHDEEGNDIIAINTHQQGSLGLFALQDWTPNMARATVVLPSEADVLLNTNYAKGWTVNEMPTKEIAGRVGTTLPAGTHEVVFQYRTPGFVVGAVASIITVMLLIFFTIRQLKR